MKKMTKKLGAVILALAMCLSLCCTALAATSDSYTITVDNSVAESEYYAFKIFDATYDEYGHVSYTIQPTTTVPSWYSVVSSATDVFDLNPSYDADGTTVNYYSVVVKDDVSEEDVIAVFEDAISWTESGIPVWAGTETSLAYDANETGNGGAIKLDVTDSGAGYYFVTTTTGAVVSLTTAAPEATVIDKNMVISMQKMIYDEDGNLVAALPEGMDEDLEFDVKATVPKYEGKNVVVDYTFEDTLSNGLLIEFTEADFNNMVNVVTDQTTGEAHYYLNDATINSWITLTAGNGETVTFTESVYNYSFELIGYDVYTDETAATTTHTFDGFVLTYYTFDYEKYQTDYNAAYDAWIAAGNDPDKFDFDSESYFTSSNYPSNASIEIKYTAHVSSLEGYDNTNDITLKHDIIPWSHPTPEYQPGDEKQSHDDVYSWELQLYKVESGTMTPLAGATFRLESENMKSVTEGYSYLYVPVAELEEIGLDGTYQDSEGNVYKVADFESTDYYKQEDGSFALEMTADGPYHRILTSKDTKVTESTHYAEGTTDAEGKLVFAGLGIGDYTLTEIVAPDGYNLLTEPIEFTISWDSENDSFYVTYKGQTGVESELNDGYILEQYVENNAGTELPSTGGIGTTIFYIIGGVLVIGAVVVLVTRRRMTREG